MDVLSILVGLAVPWALGAGVLLVISGRRLLEPGGVAWTLGCGWFVGSFLLTVWMRAVSYAGLKFGWLSVALPLVVLAGVLLMVAWRRDASVARAMRTSIAETWRSFRPRDRSPASERGWTWLGLAILAWLAVRFLLLLLELCWRPLYPWDAWAQWADKARVWFGLRSMAPFVGASEWLNAATPSVYYDPAPHYPATIPLLQTWMATLLDRWDDALVNIPWWLTGIAVGLLVYGFLAQRRFSPLLALCGAWTVLSLPILDAHIALAGYADLAMGGFFAAAALTTLHWCEERDPSDGLLAAGLCIACATIKTPGIVWVATLLPALAVALIPKRGLTVVAALAAVLAFTVALLAHDGIRVLGYALQLSFAFPWRGLLNAYFAFDNWHLLWYGACAVVLLARRQLLAPALAAFTVLIGAGIAFLLFSFTFTSASAWVEDQTTVNRATLHLAPLLVIWMFLAYREWTRAGEVPVGTETVPA